MVIPNEFLINLAPHEEVVGNCFCGDCRARRLQQVVERHHTNQQLHNLFTHRFVQKEETRLDRLFNSTLQLVVHGKAYITNSLENTNYKYFKAWAKNQQQFRHLSKKEFDHFCCKVNEANNVFDSWDLIVSNLTDYRMFYIDARRFSVRQFYLAKDISWCLTTNDHLRSKCGRNGDNNVRPYPEDKYNQILQFIQGSGILDDVGNDPQIAAAIGGRLQRDITRRANARYRPY